MESIELEAIVVATLVALQTFVAVSPKVFEILVSLRLVKPGTAKKMESIVDAIAAIPALVSYLKDKGFIGGKLAERIEIVLDEAYRDTTSTPWGKLPVTGPDLEATARSLSDDLPVSKDTIKEVIRAANIELNANPSTYATDRSGIPDRKKLSKKLQRELRNTLRPALIGELVGRI